MPICFGLMCKVFFQKISPAGDSTMILHHSSFDKSILLFKQNENDVEYCLKINLVQLLTLAQIMG